MRYRVLFILFLLVLTAFRLLYIALGPFDLSPDEAHYWEWSRRLDLSYYSKGPGVAYVIALFTGLFGDTEFAVRLGAVVFSTLSTIVLYVLSKELFGSESIAFWSALLPSITPLFSAGSILMTTDVLLVFFWLVTLLCTKRALDGKGKRWWYLAGLFTGLGFLSKYTMVLIYPCILLFILFSRDDRRWLWRGEPYIALLISIVVSSPVLLWNMMNDQVTIRHVMGQAHVGGGFSLSAGQALEFLASQAGLISPVIFCGLVFGMWRCGIRGLREGRRTELFVFFTSVTVFLFFFIKGFHGKVQANWAVVSYITAFPGTVMVFEPILSERKRALRFVLLVGIIVAFLLSAVIHFPWLLKPVAKYAGIDIFSRPPYNRVTGWEELGKKLLPVKREMEREGNLFIMSDTYQITSELAFYIPGNPVTYNVNTGNRRMNQYDLWPGFDGLLGYNALYIKGGIVEIDPVVGASFDRCDRETLTVYRDDKVIKEFSLFKCYNFRGIKPPQRPVRY